MARTAAESAASVAPVLPSGSATLADWDGITATTADSETTDRGQFTRLAAIFGLFTLLMLVWLGERLGGAAVTEYIDDFGELAAALAGAITCLVVSRRPMGRRIRAAWLLIGSGSLSWGIGQAIWSGYDIFDKAALRLPSYADAGFLTAVPLLLAGVLCFPAVRSNALARVRFILDGLIFAGSILAVSWGTVLGTTFHTSGQSIFAEVIALAYPIGDVATVTVALSLLAHTGRRYRTPLTMVIVAMVGLAISDSAYVYLTQTTSYTTGNVVDVGWVAGFLLLGLASVVPAANRSDVEENEPGRAWWQVTLPYLWLAGAIAFIAAKFASDGHFDLFLVVDALCLFAIVLIRQVVTGLEDSNLTRNLETAVATLQRNESLLSYQAIHDPLTGLGNRSFFGERIESALEREHKAGRYLAVLLCDLDHFKDANDQLGHSVGDSILVSVAQRLLACVREGDSVARVGGDEFAVILDDVTGADQASGIAVRIVDTMRMALDVASSDCYLNISVGIALRPFDQVSVEEILRDADVALYAAKNAGGDSFRLFEPSMGEAHFDRLQFQSEFGVALDSGEFFLEFEPIVNLASGEAVGVEALLRWQHPSRGVLQPHDFLELAERSGAIVPIGQWVLDQALDQLRDWHDRFPISSDLWMAVNVSPGQLLGDEFMSTVLAALEVHEIEPSLLRLELTETGLVSQVSASIDVLGALKALGVHVTIDDFGTGYSSLSYLKTMPLDTLKIDRTFVSGLDDDSYETLIVGAVVELAHARGIEVVGEGVETLAQLALLRNLRCDLGQGFYWSRSLPAERFGYWLEQHFHQAQDFRDPVASDDR